MLRATAALAAFAATGPCVFWLVTQGLHALLAPVVAAGLGAAAGAVGWGRRGLAPGAAVGALIPFVYLPLWFAYDLPPSWDCDL